MSKWTVLKDIVKKNYLTKGMFTDRQKMEELVIMVIKIRRSHKR